MVAINLFLFIALIVFVFVNRVVAVNSVTSFLLFMGKLLVVGIVGELIDKLRHRTPMQVFSVVSLSLELVTMEAGSKRKTHKQRVLIQPIPALRAAKM